MGVFVTRSYDVAFFSWHRLFNIKEGPKSYFDLFIQWALRLVISKSFCEFSNFKLVFLAIFMFFLKFVSDWVIVMKDIDSPDYVYQPRLISGDPGDHRSLWTGGLSAGTPNSEQEHAERGGEVGGAGAYVIRRTPHGLQRGLFSFDDLWRQDCQVQLESRLHHYSCVLCT